MARYVYMLDNRDYFNMLRLYFENNQKVNNAAAAYVEQYQGRGNPNRNMIRDLIDRLRRHGQLMPIYGGGRPRVARTVENIATILEFFEEESTASTRDAERELGITKSTVHRVLQEEDIPLSKSAMFA